MGIRSFSVGFGFLAALLSLSAFFSIAKTSITMLWSWKHETNLNKADSEKDNKFESQLSPNKHPHVEAVMDRAPSTSFRKSSSINEENQMNKEKDESSEDLT